MYNLIMKTEIKLSIRIPMYNTEKFIKFNVQSIIKAMNKVNMCPDEIIIINDCSTDDSLKIAKEQQKNNHNIKIINNDRNRGLGFNRNTGVKNAKGEYIWHVDADDFIHENSLKILMEEFASNKKIYFIKANKFIQKTNDIKPIKDKKWGTKEWLYLKGDVPWRGIYKKSEWIKSGASYKNRNGDFGTFAFNASLKFGKDTSFIDEQLYFYRETIDSMSNTTTLKHWSFGFSCMLETFDEVSNKEAINFVIEKKANGFISDMIMSSKKDGWYSADVIKELKRVNTDKFRMMYLIRFIPAWIVKIFI